MVRMAGAAGAAGMGGRSGIAATAWDQRALRMRLMASGDLGFCE